MTGDDVGFVELCDAAAVLDGAEFRERHAWTLLQNAKPRESRDRRAEWKARKRELEAIRTQYYELLPPTAA